MPTLCLSEVSRARAMDAVREGSQELRSKLGAATRRTGRSSRNRAKDGGVDGRARGRHRRASVISEPAQVGHCQCRGPWDVRCAPALVSWDVSRCPGCPGYCAWTGPVLRMECLVHGRSGVERRIVRCCPALRDGLLGSTLSCRLLVCELFRPKIEGVRRLQGVVERR